MTNNISSSLPVGDAYLTQSLTNYQADIQKTDSFAEALLAAKDKDDKELMEACEAFESYFLQMMFKEMRKTVPENEDGPFKKSNAELIFRDMLDEQVAINAAKGGGIGLAAFMYKQMRRENVSITPDMLDQMLEEGASEL